MWVCLKCAVRSDLVYAKSSCFNTSRKCFRAGLAEGKLLIHQSEGGVVTFANALPGITFPRVPGHEVVGRIDAVGARVTRWKPNQRVGVGFLAGPCFQFARCRLGGLVSCTNQTVTGAHTDGGYTEVMIAKDSALVAIAQELTAVDAAPLFLCAAVTTFNALRKDQAAP